jgi:sugar phosphate isomerase/epimerase
MQASPLFVQLYTVREPLAADLEATIDRIAELGFVGVELANFLDIAPRLGVALKAAALEAPSAHAKLLVGETERSFALAAALGVTTVIEPVGDRARWSTEKDVRSIAAELNSFVDLAAGYDLTLGYHNHSFEFVTLPDGRNAYDVFVDELDGRIVLEIDAYWAAVAGVDPVGLVQRYGDRVQLLHVKDGPITMEKADQLPVGSGAMPTGAVLAAAPQALKVVEFDAYQGDIFDGLAQSIAHLTQENNA